MSSGPVYPKSKKEKDSPTSLAVQKHNSADKSVPWAARHAQIAPCASSMNSGNSSHKNSNLTKKPSLVEIQGRTTINVQFKQFHHQITCALQIIH